MNIKPRLQDYLDSTQWKSQDLKVLLEHRQLLTNGYKSALVDRLVDYLKNKSMQEDLDSLSPDIEDMTKKELALECWLYFIQDIGRKNRGELLDALDDCIENGEKSEYLIQFDDADDDGAEDEFKLEWPQQSVLKKLDFLELGELCEIYNAVCIEPLKNYLEGFEDKTKDNIIEDNNMTKNSNNDNKNKNTKTKRKNSKSTNKNENKSKNKNDNNTKTKKKRKLASRLERYYDDKDDLTDDDDDDDSDEEMEQDYDNGNDNSRSDDNSEDDDEVEDDDEDDGLYISQYNANKMAEYLDSKIDCYKVLVKLRKHCQKLLKLFEKYNYDGNSNDTNTGDDLSTIRNDMICGDKEYWVGCPKRMFVNRNYNFNFNYSFSNSNSNSNSYYYNQRGVSPDEGIFGIFNSNKIAQEWIKKVENRNMLKDKFSQFNVTKGKLGIDIEIYGCIVGQVWDETTADNEDEKDNFGIEYNDTNRNKNKNKNKDKNKSETSTHSNDDDSDGDDDDDYDYNLLTNNNRNDKHNKNKNNNRNKHENKHESDKKNKHTSGSDRKKHDNKNKTVSKKKSKSKVKKSKTELIDDDSEVETESEENDIEMPDDDIDILTSKDRNNTSTVVLSDDDLDDYDDDDDGDDNDYHYFDNDNDNYSGNNFGYSGPRRINQTRSRRANH